MSPSGGVTLGFWSNKNGNKILTGSPTGNGTTLLSGVVTPAQLVPAAKRERDDPYLHQQLLRLQELVAGRHRDEHGLHAVGGVGSLEAGRLLQLCGRQRI